MSTSPYDKLRAFDLLYQQEKKYALPQAFNFKVNGKWLSFSSKKAIQLTNQLSLSLLEKGYQKGDKLAIISENRPEWNIIDFACQQIGVILVPLYPTLSGKEYLTILNHAEVKGLVVSGREILKEIQTVKSQLGALEIFTINNVKGQVTFSDLLKQAGSHNIEQLKSLRKQITPDDVMTIIYTSGTTGTPKAVMLSHRNIVSNVLVCTQYSELEKGKDKALSFLPLNHIYERTGIYLYVHLGISVYYAENIESIGDNLKEIQPHTFNTVPRLLEKVYDKILKKGSELSTIKRGVFNRAVQIGLSFDPNEKMSALMKGQYELADKLVFSKWREAIGGNIKQIQCGAAALQPRLISVFWAAGIPVYEGYGLTETSPVISVNSRNQIKVGSVGVPVPNTSVKLADDGEICVKGPNVMKGYYKNEKLTSDVFDDEGWFKTGDVGIIDKGFIQITDRKKELFKTSGGLYIAPQQIENKLKESLYIDQAMVVGEGEKYASALIVPNLENISDYASKKFMLVEEIEKLIEEPVIQRLFDKEVDQVNVELGKWGGIKNFRLVAEAWSPETGELTPTLKLKRRVLLEKYDSLIKEIYNNEVSVSFEEALREKSVLSA